MYNSGDVSKDRKKWLMPQLYMCGGFHIEKKSHLSLAGYIVDIVDADMIDHPLAFRFGSLEPDLVPSFITTKHRIDLTFHKLEKKINKKSLMNMTRIKGMTIGLSKDLGVITHYIGILHSA